MEEGADLQGFTPARANLSMREVYGEFPHHNNGTHLAGGFLDHTTWQSCWGQLAAQSASWYSMPPGKMGRQFTAVLAAEWRGVLDQKCDSERHLIFAHVVLNKTMGGRKFREIWARIDNRLDLWERGIHAGLVGGALADVRSREGRVERCV